MAKQEIMSAFEGLNEDMIKACLAFAADKEHKLKNGILKLLFGQNISPKIVNQLEDIFPDANQVIHLGKKILQTSRFSNLPKYLELQA